MARKLTLVLSITLFTFFALLVSTEASQINNHARMIKKRQASQTDTKVAVLSPTLGPVGAAPDPNTVSSPSNTNTPSATDTATAKDTQVPDPVKATNTASQQSVQTPNPSSAAAGQPTSADDGGLLGSLTSALLGGSSSASVSATSSVTNSSTSASSTPASSVPTSSTPSITLIAQPTPSAPSAPSDPATLVTVTSTSAPSASSAAADTTTTSGAASSSHLTRNTIIAIVVIAASVGGAAIIWTVIRKWKFSPSDSFEDRLNPIDWQPTAADSSSSIPEMAQHRRNNSSGSNRSFGSSDANMNRSVTPSGNYNSAMIPDLPPHDFTPGPADGQYGLAPVGAYADLRRGPSPTPAMNQASLMRGPSYNRGPYDAAGYGATQYGRSGY